MTSLDISIDQVDYIVSMARDLEDSLPRDNDDDDDESHRGEAVDLELVNEHDYDSGYQELKVFLRTLSEDELISLIALVWIGRGTHDADDLPAVLDEAREIGTVRAANYLLSIPLLAEYLEEGRTAIRLAAEEN